MEVTKQQTELLKALSRYGDSTISVHKIAKDSYRTNCYVYVIVKRLAAMNLISVEKFKNKLIVNLTEKGKKFLEDKYNF